MTCVLVRKYHIPYIFEDAIAVGTTLQAVDKNEAHKKIGRVTSRTYGRSRKCVENRCFGDRPKRALTPGECNQRDAYARKRYKEANRRLDVGMPGLTPEELLCDSLFE